MNELIQINTDAERPTVSGRELHKALEVQTAYKDWFPRMCLYGFEEGKDFSSFLSESTGGRPSTDHALTISMAKELCMLQRSEKGREFRQYFIQIEEAWNKPEAVLARALQIANRTLEDIKKDNAILVHRNAQLETQIEADKPKVIFSDAVSASTSTILIGDLAKILKQNGVNIGQKRLFEWMREHGYLIKSGNSKNMPTQRSMEMGLFEVKETVVTCPDGHIMTNKTTKVAGKGQQYFINLFLNKDGENDG